MIELLRDKENPIIEHIPDYVRNMLPYRPGKPIEELKEEYGFDRIIKLASNENPFGPSLKAIEAVKQGLQETFRYPDPISRRLRRKIAESLNITEENVVVSAGSESLLSTTIRTFMKPGEKAIAGFGAFMGFEIHLSSHGCKLTKILSPDYRFDIKGLIDAADDSTRIIYLPNPNNPTGSYITHEELKTVIENIPATTLLLLDEAYIEFCKDIKDYPDSLALRNSNLLILRTFSKAYGLAGFRIGYGIGHPLLIEHLMKVKMTFEPSLLAQFAAEAAWDDNSFLLKGIKNNSNELLRYYTVFDELGLQYITSAGNFIFVKLSSQNYVNTLNEALLKRGIAIRPLAPFGFPDCIRITIGRPEENDVLFSALRTILPSIS